MRLSQLLGLRVVSTSGWTFGKVYDVRAAHDGTLVSLVVGRAGLKERLAGRGDPTEHPHRRGQGFEIPWSEVVSIGASTITIEERNR